MVWSGPFDRAMRATLWVSTTLAWVPHARAPDDFGPRRRARRLARRRSLRARRERPRRRAAPERDPCARAGAAAGPARDAAPAELGPRVAPLVDRGLRRDEHLARGRPRLARDPEVDDALDRRRRPRPVGARRARDQEPLVARERARLQRRAPHAELQPARRRRARRRVVGLRRPRPRLAARDDRRRGDGARRLRARPDERVHEPRAALLEGRVQRSRVLADFGLRGFEPIPELLQRPHVDHVHRGGAHVSAPFAHAALRRRRRRRALACVGRRSSSAGPPATCAWPPTCTTSPTS